jgi:hypothetical protein
MFKEELRTILRSLFQKIEEKGRLPNSFYDARITLYQNQTKSVQKRKYYRPISFINIDTKLLNKMFVNKSQQYIKRIIYHDQLRFVAECKEF